MLAAELVFANVSAISPFAFTRTPPAHSTSPTINRKQTISPAIHTPTNGEKNLFKKIDNASNCANFHTRNGTTVDSQALLRIRKNALDTPIN